MSNLAIFVPDRGQSDWVDQVFTRIFAQLLKAQRETGKPTPPCR